MSKNWAIVIGINNYNPNNFTPLKYAKHDAECMKKFFLDDAKFEEVYFFSDDLPDIVLSKGKKIPTQPTYGNLISFLHDRFEKKPFLSSGDNCWFFFAGHGEQYDNRDYLMPQDANPRAVEKTAIPVSYVRERLSRSGADNVILILDACRSEGSRGAAGIGNESQQGAIIISSCSPTQKSWEIEELQQGVFTYALLEGLRMSGERNCATVERLDEYLRYRVPQLCQKYRKYPEQNPRIAVDPIEKRYFILMPQYATKDDRNALRNDINALKLNAYRAQCDRNFDLAQQFWLQINAAAQGRDTDAIKELQNIAQIKSAQTASSTLLQPSSPGLGSRASLPVEVQPSNLNPSSQFQRKIPNFSRRLRLSTTGVELAKSALRQKRLTQKALAQNCGLTQSAISRFMKQELIDYKSFDMICEALDLKLEEIADNSAAPSIPHSQTNQSYETITIPFDTRIFEFDTIRVNQRGQEVERRRQTAEYCTENIGNGIVLEMVSIPGGTFLMGSLETEFGRLKNEAPQHSVTLKPFLMGKYPITQAQWEVVASLPKVHRELELNPSHFQGANRPVEQVPWHDAVEFCDRLAKKTGHEYRLPTEAEWEYACRAGSTTPFHFGETITPQLANYDCKYSYRSAPKGTFRKQTTSVGYFPFSNAFGLFDMHGLIWEWCLDYWHESYDNAPTDGSTWLTNSNNNSRVLRGGSWYNDPLSCRSAYRYSWDGNDKVNRVGFRIVCTVVNS